MLRDLILRIILRKEKDIMPVIYATLIVKDKKKFKDVPPTIKEEVRELLIALDCEHLIIE